VYYFDNDKDMKQALTWMEKVNSTDPKFWNLHTEAKIRMKMKDYKGAAAAAEKSKKLAIDAKNADYVKMNDEVLVTAAKNGK
jgi:RPA family protein